MGLRPMMMNHLEHEKTAKDWQAKLEGLQLRRKGHWSLPRFAVVVERLVGQRKLTTATWS